MSKKLFAYAISNPPYQDSSRRPSSPQSIYPDFMERTYAVADQSVFITPARFLFGAGNVSKDFIDSRLSDEHFDVIKYYPDSREVFGADVDIKGGVAITLRDDSRNLGPVGVRCGDKYVYVPEVELRGIVAKVCDTDDFEGMDIHIAGSFRFNLDQVQTDYPECFTTEWSKDTRFRSNTFERFTFLTDHKVEADDVEIFGRLNGERTSRWCPSRYVSMDDPMLAGYKVFVPKANGSGSFGEVLSTPVIGTPVIGCTETFLAIGSFKTETEAINLLRYIKSRFCRTMVGILKRTQDNSKRVWTLVPWQDFTNDSDIDWTKSIEDIDTQLFDKYGLDDVERDFILKNVAEMV